MLQRIYIDNFRCLVNFELKLGPLSLLIGDNGAGKSTVFEVLRRLQDFVAGRQKASDAFLPDNLTRWQTRHEQTFEVELSGEHGKYTYALSIEISPELQKSRVVAEKLSDDGGPLYAYTDGHAQLYRNDHSTGPRYPFDWSVSGLSFITPRNENTKLTTFKQQLEKLLILSLLPSEIASTSQGESQRPSYRGDNFASWWRVLSQEHPELVNETNSELAKVLMNFVGAKSVGAAGKFRELTLVFGPPEVNSEFSKYDRKNLEFTFDEISDGQRALFILYTLVIALKGQGYSLFLDEPENYVSLREIQPWLMLLKDACDDGIDQACIISHHPEQINYLGAEFGIWFDRVAGGATRTIEPRFQNDEGLSLAEAVARGWHQ